MATGYCEEDGAGWWGGWIQTAKQKSAVAFEQMRKDLSEFGSTIQKDTSTMVATSAEVLSDSMQTDPNETSTRSRVKQGFSDLLSGLSESLAPKDSWSEEEPHTVSSKSSHHIFDRAKARLHSMQIDASTYCTDPEGSTHAYEDWLQSFDTERYKGDISDLLVANTDVRAIYTKLVPAVVSNVDFWGRYFYKVHQLNQDEARRAALKVRADMTSSQTFDEEEFQWDDDEDDSSDTLHVHEGRNNDLKLLDHEDRMPTISTDVVYTEEQRSEESGHDSDDGLPMATAIEIHSQQSHDLNKSHDGLNEEATTEKATTEEAKIEPVEEDTCTIAQPRTTPEENDNGAASQLPDGKVSDRQEESCTKRDQLGGEEDVNITPGDECKEDNDTREYEDTKDMVMDADTLMVHVPTPEVHCNKPVDKRTSPSGSDSSNYNKDSSLSDDWERDFDDIDVTEDLAAAILKTNTQPADGNEDEDLDDWTSWE